MVMCTLSVRIPLLTVPNKLHSCEAITTALMVAITYSSMLEVLELDNFSLLTSVILQLPQLQNTSNAEHKSFLENDSEDSPSNSYFHVPLTSQYGADNCINVIASKAPEVLYYAKKTGVAHILKAGGAQAISAMAWGT